MPPADDYRKRADAPILDHKTPAAESVFAPEALLREARRQKDLASADVPAVCILDPDGDILRNLRKSGRAVRFEAWPCYHTQLFTFPLAGQTAGIIGCAVGAPFAVLVAEELFACGCRLLLNLTSAGQIEPAGPPPYFVVIDRALRDEGTSYHYAAPAKFAYADPDLVAKAVGGLTQAGLHAFAGASWTTDAPFRETAEAIAAARAKGVLAVEMEAAALYAFARARGKPVLCLAHVTNTMGQAGQDFEKGQSEGTTDALQVLAAVVQALAVVALDQPAAGRFSGGSTSRGIFMKAMLLTGHGGPEMLRYGEAPDPVPGPGEVVIDVHAASVNGADPKVRRGGGGYTLSQFPHILGRDFSGMVSSLGEGVTDLKVGDAVFGVLDQGQEGAYAEKLAIKASLIAKKPDSLSHSEAAALGLISLTALTAIEDTAKLKKGETILIQGGAGGVAGFAVQLAKNIGAHVIATASAGNHAYVRDLGADQVIDYNVEDFGKIGPVCDVVFDTVGGAVREACYKVLKPGGRLVWIAPAPHGFTVPRNDIQTLRPDVQRDRAHLERMLELVAAGAVKPPAITRYALADAAKAHEVSEGRHLQGKLVLEVR